MYALPVTQAAPAVAVLVFAALLPRTGEPVLLVPLVQQDTTALPSLSSHDLALIGPGRWPGTLVVYHTEKFPISAVLRLGFIPLAVPVSLCRQPSEVGQAARDKAPLAIGQGNE